MKPLDQMTDEELAALLVQQKAQAYDASLVLQQTQQNIIAIQTVQNQRQNDRADKPAV